MAPSGTFWFRKLESEWVNVRTRACSRTSIARTKQAALTHNVRGKELMEPPTLVHNVLSSDI